ncbi:MAG: hypothetical protein AB2L12_08920 [Smithellaceae bacterium]
MIEVHLAYDIKPGIDELVYFEWLKKEIVKVLKMKGIIEVRAQRNIRGNPGVLVIAQWEKLENWTEFSGSEMWNALINTLKRAFAENVRIEVWGDSPVLPAPLRPPK